MLRDEFRHLEHAHLALAVEYRPESVVGVNLRSLLFVLKAIFLDVIPKLLSELRTWDWFRTYNGREFLVGLHRPHEGGIRLAFGRSFCGFRHTR
jgi:hypothetical protein